MELVQRIFQDILIIRPKVFKDSRGFFQESYSQRSFAKLGISEEFIQDNHSYSMSKNTIRGLHFQNAPMAQTKIVRVAKGRIWDVFVDLRKNSPSFGQYQGLELSEDNHLQIMIPKGFAHGFCCLSNDCHVVYKVDQYYSPEHNNGILWSDPTFNIKWPCDAAPILSEQDTKWPLFSVEGQYF